MFGKNEIVSPSWFKKFKDNELYVTSRFYTLQGEGPFSGQPAVFIRLAKCNLACTFCDTYFDSGTIYDFNTLIVDCVNEVHKTCSLYCENDVGLVITGGEPMLQKTALEEFLPYAHKHFKWVQIETNGTVMGDIPSDTVVVCSPKAPVPVREGMQARYIKPKKEWLKRIDALKFVVSADPKSEQHTVPDWAIQWHKDYDKPVYISPMNMYNKFPKQAKTQNSDKPCNIEQRSKVDEVISFWEPGLLDMDANEKNHKYAGELCMQHGFILNLQTHLYVSLA